MKSDLLMTVLSYFEKGPALMDSVLNWPSVDMQFGISKICGIKSNGLDKLGKLLKNTIELALRWWK